MTAALTRALGGTTPTTLNREARTVEVVALSGLAPAVRPAPAPDGTRTAWVEELAAAGADLSRFINGPALKDHQNRTDAAVGTVAEARIEGDRIAATVRFDGSTAADDLISKVEAGSVRGVSLGYRVTKWATAGKRDGLPVFRATAWAPHELSFTPVPVDAGATVRSEGETMSDITTAAPTEHSAQITTDANTRATVNAEIRSMARVAGLDQTWIDGQIDTGASVESARAAAFAELARRGGVTIRTDAPVTVGTDHTDPATIRRSMADALAARLCPSLVKPEGRARDFMGHRALDMVGELAVTRGERLNRFNQNALLERAIGAHSTGDFPLLLADAGNKILLAQYAAAAPTYRKWAVRKSFNDFKPHKFLRAGDFPSFKNLAENGEVKYGTISENREAVTPAEFAAGIAIGRKALINDDLSALGDFSSMIAIRAASDENRMVYGLLTSNPAMNDGKAMFHTDHANKAGAGAAISITSIAAAVAALRKQKSLDGIPLNLTAVYLVVGPDKELEAKQVVASITPTKAGDANPWAGSLEVVVDANITGNAWYVMCDGVMCPCIVYGYVNGAEGPQILTERDFDTQAVKVRAGLDFGYGVIDFRGAYFNAGA